MVASTLASIGTAIEKAAQVSNESTSKEIAEAARVRNGLLRRTRKGASLEQLCQLYPSRTTSRLRQIVHNSDEAAIKLSLIGYENLRHLRASGMLFAEIAEDLQVNINDLIAYMRLSPTAHADALQDEETCADSRTLALDRHIDNFPLKSKFDSEKLRLKTQIQLEMNKRLSAKWALRTDREALMANQGAHISIEIGTVDKDAAAYVKPNPLPITAHTDDNDQVTVEIPAGPQIIEGDYRDSAQLPEE